MTLEYKFENGEIQAVSSQTKCRDSLCWGLLTLVLLIVSATAGWLYLGGYFTTLDSTGPQALSLRSKINKQETQLTLQEKEIDKLSKNIATTIREKEIQFNVNKELNSKSLLAEDQLSEFKKKLLLYENILSPEDLKKGLHIQYFGVKKRILNTKGEKIDTQKNYRFHVILSHAKGEDKIIKGNFKVNFIGKIEDKKITLVHTKLAVKGKEDSIVNSFSIKYYQSIEGEVVLPNNFTPEKVEVNILPANKNQLQIKKTYSWESLK